MGIIVRQSVKGTVVTYLGAALGFFTTFFVLTKYLTAEEVGLTKVMMDAAVLLAGLGQLGTNTSIMRFFPHFNDEKNGDHGFFFWTIVVPLIGISIYSIIYLLLKVPICNFFAQNSQLFVDYFYFVIPLAFFMLYTTVFETNSNVLQRIAVPKLIREVGIRLMLLVTYLLYGFKIISLDGMMISFCAIYAIATLLNIIYLLSLRKISFKPDFKFITKEIRREYLMYTLFLILAALGGLITPIINSFFVSAKMGLESTGIFTIATYVTSVIGMAYVSLYNISQPLISHAIRHDEMKEAEKLSKKVSYHQLIISTLVFLLIWININLFFDILPNGDLYRKGKYVIFILGISKVTYSTLSISGSVLSYSNHYYYSLWLSFLLMGIAIILNLILIPLYGLEGASLATLASYLLFFTLQLALIKWKISVNVLTWNHLIIVGGTIVLFFANYCWNRYLTPIIQSSFDNTLLATMIDCIIRTVLFGIISLVALYFSGISEEINGIIRKILKPIWKTH
ncbi:MAG: oligosaccharide flippase family protein [Bacteroidales bacterium]|jgi:O-antigen/teichoic acid export membrane protein|nr:oligosaccharide flippase family protein [Bacteroidales bacterium]HPH53500.1 oligosaccharide flippase family protein [Bacteroidales bacterium]